MAAFRGWRRAAAALLALLACAVAAAHAQDFLVRYAAPPRTTTAIPADVGPPQRGLLSSGRSRSAVALPTLRAPLAKST